MLLRITDHCMMACNHCFINATPKGKHMDFKVVMQSVTLANKLGVKALLISGGEPTDHPNYFDIIDYVKFNYSGQVIVISHGLFIDDKEYREKVFGQYKDVMFQITNDKRYYPKQLNRITAGNIERKHKNVSFIWKIGGELYPQGRARKHMGITDDTAKVKGTRCFNLRSIVNSVMEPSIAEAISMLELRGRFCTPSININGSIAMGESNQCPETATVTESIDLITQRFKESQCNDCGMLNKLPKTHKDAIRFKG